MPHLLKLNNLLDTDNAGSPDVLPVSLHTHVFPSLTHAVKSLIALWLKFIFRSLPLPNDKMKSAQLASSTSLTGASTKPIITSSRLLAKKSPATNGDRLAAITISRRQVISGERRIMGSSPPPSLQTAAFEVARPFLSRVRATPARKRLAA